MINWIILSIGLITSWNYTDLESESAFSSMVCPVLVLVFIALILLKLVAQMGPESGRSGYSDGYGGGGFLGDSGADGGGGGD